jgi:putative colanic acid biosynthesis acetyltransferase WcaF
MQFQQLNSFQLPRGFRGRSGIFVQCWWVVQTLLFKTSPQCMYAWRRFLLRCFGAQIGTKVKIRPSVHIQFPWKIAIGDYSWIGDNVVLYSLGDITIGKNVVISQKSYLCTGSHNYTDKNFAIYSLPIIIEDSCWLATDVFVSPGIVIRNGTVVGARSSVFHSLPAGKICFGTPAMVIKNRPSPFTVNPLYHNLYESEEHYQQHISGLGSL